MAPSVAQKVGNHDLGNLENQRSQADSGTLYKRRDNGLFVGLCGSHAGIVGVAARGAVDGIH